MWLRRFPAEPHLLYSTTDLQVSSGPEPLNPGPELASNFRDV
jgi:hypothetical protein